MTIDLKALLTDLEAAGIRAIRLDAARGRMQVRRGVRLSLHLHVRLRVAQPLLLACQRGREPEEWSIAALRMRLGLAGDVPPAWLN